MEELLRAKPVAMESSSANWLELTFNASDHSSVALNASQSAIDAILVHHKPKQKKEKRWDDGEHRVDPRGAIWPPAQAPKPVCLSRLTSVTQKLKRLPTLQ
jgi:hypothetical protein